MVMTKIQSTISEEKCELKSIYLSFDMAVFLKTEIVFLLHFVNYLDRIL